MDRTRRPRLAALALALLAATALPAGAAAIGAATGQGQPIEDAERAGIAATDARSATLAPQEIDPDAVDITVALQPDGDAHWTISYRMALTTENETEAFRLLQRDVRNNTSDYLDRFRQRIASTIAAAENTTGREMSATNFSVHTRYQAFGGTDYGFVVYEFTWKNFARVDDPRIYAGEAISGFYVDNETTLQFTYPEPYGLVSADPEPDPDVSRAGVVGWTGPLDFTAEEPRVVVSTEAAATTTATSPPPADEGGLPLTGFAIAAALVLVALAAAWYYREGGGPSDESGSEPEPGSESASAPGSGGATSPSGAEAGEAGEGTAAASEEAETTAEGEAEEEPPEELMSNEEKVLRYLREHGGRAKQQEIVDGLGWTEAKTSQVLGDMREEGTVEGFRLGRENVIKLPDEERDGGEDGGPTEE